ncbi:hypothetical protein HYDPIDRAFT_34670, partial [Hydnomerulius pinastri MD-312]
MYRLMVASGRNWRDMHAPHGVRPASNPGKQYQLLGLDYANKLFQHLLHPSTNHYIHSSICKLSTLHSDLISPFGGLLSVLVMDMEDRLRMCFNEVILKEEDVDEIIELMSSEVESDAWRSGSKRREQIMRELRNAPTVFDAIGDSLRHSLDLIFVEHLQHKDVRAHFGNTSHDSWMAAYWSYVPDVIREVDDCIQILHDNDAYQSLSGATKITHDNAKAKFKLILRTIGWDNEPNALPFMTASVWGVLKDIFSQLPLSIVEVSSWFSNLIQSAPAMRSWSIGSASADAIRAIMACPDIEAERMGSAVRDFVYGMVVLLPALCEMEQQILALGLPKRILVQKDLLKSFGIVEKTGKRAASATATATAAVVAEDENENEEENEDADEDGEEDEDEDMDARASQKRQLTLLSREVEVIVGAMKSGGKSRPKVRQGSSRNPQTPEDGARPDFMEPWSGTSKLQPGSHETIRVASVLNAVTFNWSTDDSHSNKRLRRTIACMALQEHCINREFRAVLLDDTYGAAAHIRAVLERRLEFEFKHGQGAKEPPKLDVDGRSKGKGKGKARVGQQDKRGDAMRVYAWPDGIKFDSPRAANMSFSSYDPNNKYRKKVIFDTQIRSVQNLVNSIQRVQCAFLDGNVDLRLTKRPPLHPEVVFCIRNLVDALSNNAYVHREPLISHSKTFEPDGVPEDQRLPIAIRGEENDDDEGSNAKGKKNKKSGVADGTFLVEMMTRDDELSLKDEYEDMRRQRQIKAVLEYREEHEEASEEDQPPPPPRLNKKSCSVIASSEDEDEEDEEIAGSSQASHVANVARRNPDVVRRGDLSLFQILPEDTSEMKEKKRRMLELVLGRGKNTQPKGKGKDKGKGKQRMGSEDIILEDDLEGELNFEFDDPNQGNDDHGTVDVDSSGMRRSTPQLSPSPSPAPSRRRRGLPSALAAASAPATASAPAAASPPVSSLTVVASEDVDMLDMIDQSSQLPPSSLAMQLTSSQPPRHRSRLLDYNPSSILPSEWGSSGHRVSSQVSQRTVSTVPLNSQDLPGPIRDVGNVDDPILLDNLSRNLRMDAPLTSTANWTSRAGPGQTHRQTVQTGRFDARRAPANDPEVEGSLAQVLVRATPSPSPPSLSTSSIEDRDRILFTPPPLDRRDIVDATSRQSRPEGSAPNPSRSKKRPPSRSLSSVGSPDGSNSSRSFTLNTRRAKHVRPRLGSSGRDTPDDTIPEVGEGT